MKKLLILLALCCLLVAPACALVGVYNSTADSSGGGLALRSHILFNVTVKELGNMTDLQSIVHDIVYVARPTSDTGYTWSDGSAPFTATVSDNTGLHEIGSGTISGEYVSNSSTTTAYYKITLEFDSWDKTSVTGGLTGQKHVNLSYDYASLGVVPSYRNSINTYPIPALSYNESAFLSYETPTDTSFYVPRGDTAKLIYTTYSYTPRPLVVDFTCNAAGNVPAPHSLFCTRNVTGGTPINQTWTLNYPGGGQTISTNTSLSATLSELGYYGVNLTSCSALQCGSASKPNLFNLTAPGFNATGISFWVHTYDPLKSAKVSPSTIGIQNTTSGVWRNLSATGSALFSSTDYYGTELLTAGQTVGLMGTATGYEIVNTTVTIPYDGWEYILNLVPTGDVPQGAYSTMYVNVINSYTAEALSGATVTISNSTIPYSSSKLSNAGGVAVFANITAGTYQITASKTGYQSSTTNWPTTGGVVSNAYIGLLPVGATPVVTGTGGDPLYDENGNPIVGYDLDGNPITASPTQDTRSNDEKAEGMMDIFYENGEGLIMLFILFTIMYMLKGIVW